MKKQYASPTYSSNQKTLPNSTVRERLVRLTETVNELRTNVETEAQNQDSLEKVSSKNYTLMNTQIKALRKAFNTLADVIMEELDSIKGEVFRDFQDSNSSIYRKLDELSSQVARLENEKQNQKSQMNAVEQVLTEKIKVLERKGTENYENIQAVAENSKDDQRELYEKLTVAIRNNTTRLDQLESENEELRTELNDLKNKTNNDTSSIKELYHKIAHIDDEYKHQTQELANKLADSKTQTGNLRESLKGEIQNIVKAQGDFTRRIEEIHTRTHERAQADEVASQKRFAELEDLVNQIQQEFQDNVQELAKIHKESSTQIIVDFEKAITSINNDNKILYKKFGVIEGSLGKTREELGTMIADHEHTVSRKNENFNRAIFDICRQLNISNPLLSY